MAGGVLWEKGIRGLSLFPSLLPTFHWEQLERIGKNPRNADAQEGSACSVTGSGIRRHSRLDVTLGLLRGEVMDP